MRSLLFRLVGLTTVNNNRSTNFPLAINEEYYTDDSWAGEQKFAFAISNNLGGIACRGLRFEISFGGELHSVTAAIGKLVAKSYRHMG